MTDREEDREAFLARWSRRKREAAANRSEPRAEESPPPKPAAKETRSAPQDEPPVPPPPSSPEPALPPIESIDAGTDIRAFLEQGVPPDLARAALRRAWRSDPAIRDFVGLSENAWDFTASEGVPGFGPLARDAARQLVAQVLDEGQSARAEPAAPGAALPGRSAKAAEPEHAVVKPGDMGSKEARPVGGVDAPEEPSPHGRDSAMQQQEAGLEPPPRSPHSSSK